MSDAAPEPSTPEAHVPTGHPVFDFQADNRLRSAALQRRMLTFGLADLAAGGLLWIFAARLGAPPWAAPVLFFAGCLLLVAGVAWGYLWRGRLREAFRREHGADS